MKIDFLPEPELEFGSGRHIDIRFGITDYGPHDLGEELAPRAIRVGMVGTPEHIELARDFLERCRTEVRGPASRQPNLRPAFPGFRPDTAFHSTLVLDDRLMRTIPARQFEELRRRKNANDIVRDAVSVAVKEFEYLERNVSGRVPVVVEK